MIVTEEEARAKLCQETFTPEDWDKCSGSRCMAWRWMQTPPRYSSSTPRDGWEHVSEEEAPEHDSNTEFWLEPESEWLARRKGFCGKAGWPHHA